MPASYVRQSTFSNGDIIEAALFNAEYDQLVAAFHKDTGHNHDGTAGTGAPIPFIQKDTSGVYVDTSNPAAHKIVLKIAGVTVSEITSTVTAVTDKIKHTPAHDGVPRVLNEYLDTLHIAVGTATADAEAAELAAERAEAAAMQLGIPKILADGETYDIPATSVQVDIICLGAATVNLPATLTVGNRYSIRVSSTATAGKQCILMNPSFNIIGDKLTVGAGDNLVISRSEFAVMDVITPTNLEII